MAENLKIKSTDFIIVERNTSIEKISSKIVSDTASNLANLIN